MASGPGVGSSGAGSLGAGPSSAGSSDIASSGARSYGAGPPGSAPRGFEPLRRTPTDSSYMYTGEARSQQAGAPAGIAKPYPSLFKNIERRQLTTPGSYLGAKRKWLHHPLKPGKAATWRAGSPGGIRSVYTHGNTNKFDVVYHDPKATTFNDNGGDFVLAVYYEGVPSPSLSRPSPQNP
ncbi:hypothetical protein BJ875DRAFT_490264 [Amylocarpus encephaloides]|uniref:Uncharacterized protein n=1 Tax=Amylocarpus encephaloides TaxID=45428 RepID=A0A9P8BYK2_9HELO|nr:hypothetical protein BJ875DRAFT_490264 [Amylocarpus encephaloides]